MPLLAAVTVWCTALDTRTGCLVWAFEADAGVRSTPVVDRAVDGRSATVYFGDAHAQVYALDAATGAMRWKVKVDDHPDAIVTGGAAILNGRLYVGVSSLEEGTAVVPTYQCCTFRGSVVSLDAATGRQVWKTFTVDEPRPTTKNSLGTQLFGPSGVGVWSAPVLDPDRNRLYVGTGDSYSNPPARESDAIMALAMDTGRVVWTQQTLAGDAWNVGCFETTGPGRVNCPESPAPITTTRAAHHSWCLPMDVACCSPVRSRESCTVSIPSRASCCGKRERAREGSWAASNGALPPTAPLRTSHCPTRSRRRRAKPAGSWR